MQTFSRREDTVYQKTRFKAIHLFHLSPETLETGFTDFPALFLLQKAAVLGYLTALLRFRPVLLGLCHAVFFLTNPAFLSAI